MDRKVVKKTNQRRVSPTTKTRKKVSFKLILPFGKLSSAWQSGYFLIVKKLNFSHIDDFRKRRFFELFFLLSLNNKNRFYSKKAVYMQINKYRNFGFTKRIKTTPIESGAFMRNERDNAWAWQEDFFLCQRLDDQDQMAKKSAAKFTTEFWESFKMWRNSGYRDGWFDFFSSRKNFNDQINESFILILLLVAFLNHWVNLTVNLEFE